jgi:hypothetical protein
VLPPNNIGRDSVVAACLEKHGGEVEALKRRVIWGTRIGYHAGGTLEQSAADVLGHVQAEGLRGFADEETERENEIIFWGGLGGFKVGWFFKGWIWAWSSGALLSDEICLYWYLIWSRREFRENRISRWTFLRFCKKRENLLRTKKSLPNNPINVLSKQE